MKVTSDDRTAADKSSIKHNSTTTHHQTVQRPIGAQCYYFKNIFKICIFHESDIRWQRKTCQDLMTDPPGSRIILPVISAQRFTILMCYYNVTQQHYGFIV